MLTIVNYIIKGINAKSMWDKFGLCGEWGKKERKITSKKVRR